MKFAQEAPGCTWITHQLMKEFRVLKLVSFLDLFQELCLNSFEFLLQFAQNLINQWF
jgi:hypothetical protein